MNVTSVRKIARVLHVLVLIALVCNVVILYLVPVAVLSGGPSLLEGVGEYLGGILHPGEDDIVTAGIAASFLSWFWCWQDPETLALTLFLVVSGVCTAVILWQGKRVLETILRGEPFSMENAVSLRRAAVCAFLIALAVRISVGSATVAMTMAAGIVASMPMVATLSQLHLACLVMAIAGGSTAFSHFNDSGFWFVKSLCNLDEKTTFKTWTMMETIVGTTGFVAALIISFFA